MPTRSVKMFGRSWQEKKNNLVVVVMVANSRTTHQYAIAVSQPKIDRTGLSFLR